MSRPALAVGLLVAGLGLVTMRGALGGGQDEEIVFVQVASLYRDRDLAFDEGERAEVAAHCGIWEDALAPTADGRWSAVYGPAQAWFALPLYALGRLVADPAEPAGRALLVRWTAALNPLLTALTAALLCLWLGQLGQPRRVAVGGALAYALATMAWPYAKTFLSEPLSALTLTVAAYAAWRSGTEGRPAAALAAGLALAAAILTRPHNVILAPFILALLPHRSVGAPTPASGDHIPDASPSAERGDGWRRGGGLVLLASLPVTAAAGWWLAVNAARFGSPLDFGYQAAIQSDFALRNVPIGLVGQLFSPGRGLLWYAPPAALAVVGFGRLAASHRRLARTLLLAVAGQAVFYSLRSTWWGNWCWGPRYFVPVLPLLLLLAAPALADPRRGVRWTTGGLLALGVATAWAGLIVYNGLYQSVLFAEPDGLRRLLWTFADAPWVGHWRYAAAYPDLMVLKLWQADPAVGLTATLVRGLPALVGGWWLVREGRDGR